MQFGLRDGECSCQVADLVKMDRLNRLNLVVNEIVEERAQRFANRDLEVGTACRLSIYQKVCHTDCSSFEHTCDM